MMKAYPIFTIDDQRVPIVGARVDKFKASAGWSVPAILVGEQGRGRSLGVLPVSGAKPGDTIVAASIAVTKSGKPKLVTASAPNTTEAAIVVLRTPIGYRGSNDHTGDALPSSDDQFLPFPGEWLVKGRIAQGDAGRMGSGEQGVALIPRDIVFRTWLGGRVYGAPRNYYYVFCDIIYAVTWQERELLPDNHPLAMR